MQSYSAPKEAPPQAMPATPAHANMQGGMPAGHPMMPGRPEWTVPAGWKALPAEEIRYAVFATDEGQPPLLLTVIPLNPSPLAANVNRWAGELGREPVPPDQLDKVVTHLNVGGLPADVVDLTGPANAEGGPQRTLAAMISQGGQMWFFKMKGPADRVAKQKSNFDAFIKSIHFVTGAPTGAQQPAPETAQMPEPAAPDARWSVPAGWVMDRTPHMMREATFKVGSGDKIAEVIVSKMGTTFGSLADNINRWRGQVGLEPAKDPAAEKPQKVKIGPVDGQLYDFTGLKAADQPQQRLLVAMATVGDSVWFFKMQGAVETVTDQRNAFESFLKSVSFADSKPGQR